MNDFISIFLLLSVVTCLIYFLYRILIGAGEANNEEDLQITSSEILEQLNILFKQKKYSIVESLARKYLEKKNNDEGVRSILAKSMHASGRTYEAIEQAKIITDKHPDNTNMQLFLANCYLAVENQMKAIEILKSVLDNFPEHVSVIRQLAQVFYNTNQKKSAAKMYEKLCDLIDNNTEKAKLKTIIAEIHVDYNEIDMAIEVYEQILEIYPEDTELKKRLISLYKLVSDYDSIIAIASDIVSFSQNDESGLWAMHMLMEVYNATHDYDKALEYSELIKNHPMVDKIQWGKDVAKILLKKEQIEEGVQMLEALVLQAPKNIELKKDLAEAYKKKNDYESAVIVYKKLLDEADPRDIKELQYEISVLYSDWAMYLFELKDSERCFKNFIIALQYYSQNPEIYIKLGNVNHQIKNYNEAIVQYKKAIDLDKYNINCYYALSECYQEIGSIYEQKKVLSESLNYDANNPVVHYQLGLIYQSQSDLENAVSHLKKAIDLNPTYVEAMHKLALIYEHIGNNQNAIILYSDILKLEPYNDEVANNLKMLNSEI